LALRSGPTGVTLIVIHPYVEVKAIERDASITDRYLGKSRTHLGIEAIAVHTEVAWRVAVADETGKDGHWGIGFR